jgi:hypothetical protein
MHPKLESINRAQSVMKNENIYLKNDVSIFQQQSTSEIIPIKNKH